MVCLRFFSLLGDDVLTVEGQTMFHALLAGRRMGFGNVLVETDSAILYACLTRPYENYICQIQALVYDILHMQRSYVSCSFRLVPRNLNKVADLVAKKCLGDKLPLGWDLSNQPKLACLCTADAS